MGKSIAKSLDTCIAMEFELTLSPFTMVLKNAIKLPNVIQGFIFVLVKDGVITYDRVDAWSQVNGRRLRIPRFRSCPRVEMRLTKKMYRRWYIWGNGILYPFQTTTVKDLKDNFNFRVDDDPRHREIYLFDLEALRLRNKSLLFHRTKLKWNDCSNIIPNHWR